MHGFGNSPLNWMVCCGSMPTPSGVGQDFALSHRDAVCEVFLVTDLIRWCWSVCLVDLGLVANYQPSGCLFCGLNFAYFRGFVFLMSICAPLGCSVVYFFVLWLCAVLFLLVCLNVCLPLFLWPVVPSCWQSCCLCLFCYGVCLGLCVCVACIILYYINIVCPVMTYGFVANAFRDMYALLTYRVVPSLWPIILTLNLDYMSRLVISIITREGQTKLLRLRYGKPFL